MRSKKNTQWMRLDNAAKIFPPTCDKRDPKVFRFSCELFEEVIPEHLQSALEHTMEIFPMFNAVLKHGFFWYYLEQTQQKPIIHQENDIIFREIYDKNSYNLLFEVTYYKKRINLNMFHALTDGTGALEFMKTLVCKYLVEAHADVFGERPPVSDYDASATERMADSFQKYYDPSKKGQEKFQKAYKVFGTRLSENRVKVIEGIMPANQVVALARSYKTTVTVLLASIMMRSIYERMPVRDRKKPIALSIPVNLRNHFASESSRNFFGIVQIRHNFSKGGDTLPLVIESLSRELKLNLTPEKLANRMNALVSVELNAAVRAIPLLLKDLGLRLAYNVSDMGITASLSNLGNVKMPAGCEKYIRLFDVITSTKKIQICMCSYQNNMVVSFTDPFISADIQKYFFRTLADLGVSIEIVTNPLEENL